MPILTRQPEAPDTTATHLADTGAIWPTNVDRETA